MKKTLFAMTAIVFTVFAAGCGQDINLTVYNDTGITPYALAYCGARVETDDATTNKLFTGTGNVPENGNSFSIQVKEGRTVNIYGYGYYYQADSNGNTTLQTYSRSATAQVYGGYLESPNWYAALFMDKILIYKK